MLRSVFCSAIFIISIFFAVWACRSKNENIDWKIQSREKILRIINRPVRMPDSIPLSHPEDWVENIMASKGKILFSVDIDCSACFAKFRYWENFTENFEERHGIELPILAVIESSDFRDEHVEKMNSVWRRGWIYDPNGDFTFENELDDDRLQAVLLDANDTIRLVGSPLFNEILGKMYEEKILEFLLL